MDADTMYLAKRLRDWLTRFIDGSDVSISSMIAVKTDYREKYGVEELRRIVNEVTLEVARGMSHANSKLPEVSETSWRIRHPVRKLWRSMASSRPLRGCLRERHASGRIRQQGVR